MTDNETQPFDQDLYDRAKAEHAKNFEHDPGPWGSTDHYKTGFVAGVNAAARLAPASRQPVPVVEEDPDVRWWGWNFAQGKWFPCLGPEFRECVTSEGVIIQADLDHRDQVRDDLIRAVREALAAQAVQVPTLDADGHLMEHLREIQREQNAYWGKDDYESQFAMEIAELTGVWFEQKAFWTGECWEGDDVEWDLNEWKSRQAEQAKGGHE